MDGQLNRRRYPQNHASVLLTPEENEAVFRYLGDQNFTLATGVVQLLAAEPSSRNQWTKRHFGVVCLVKDYSAHGYFLRLYDIINGFLLWEQVMFDEFYSVRLCAELIAFEGDNCVFGLNFASVDEAADFKRALDLRVEALQRKLTRERAHRSSSSTVNTTIPVSSTASFTPVTSMGVVMPSHGSITVKEKQKGKKVKKRITKEEIGEPTNFEHRLHVGWDPKKGYACHMVKEDMDPDIRAILHMVNLPTDFKADKTAVYSVINQFGGVEAVKRDLELEQRNRTRKAAPPPMPPRLHSTTAMLEDQRPPKPVRKPMQELPRIASRTKQEVNHVDAVAPPSPPPPSPPPPLAPELLQRREGPIAKPPVAPPPPPMVPFRAEEATPVPIRPDARADLLAEIRQGKSLKPVGEAGISPPARVDKKEAAPMNGRDDMVSQISQGVSLKPVEKTSAKDAGEDSMEMQGIAAALARALMERRKQVADDDSSDEDEEEEDDDEDWED